MPFPKVDKILKASELPSDSKLVSDEILKQAIECEVSGKPFRLIQSELEFYRKHSLPLPKRHPDIRHADRMKFVNPRKLRDRTCAKCGTAIKTSYAPQKPALIYCTACYNKAFF